MLVAALTTLLLVGGPDEEVSPAAKKLRVAWASQYEWREDAIKSVSIDFEWERSTKTPRDQADSKGTGQVVVVGNEIKRIHIEGQGPDKELRAAVRWVIERYARKPFEEAFKDIELKLLERSLSGDDKVKAGRRVYILKNDRIIAIERPLGGVRKGNMRVDFKLDGMGDGYARVRESFAQKRDGVKETTTRALVPREGSETPQPGRYNPREDKKGGLVITLAITFREPKTNQKDAVTIDPAARDILRDAWKQRYVIPKGSIYVAQFTRKPGKLLGKSGWNTVQGEFEVDEKGKLEVVITDKAISGRSWRDVIRGNCEQHLYYLFELLRDVAFEEAFEGCGFVRQDSPLGTVVRVYGYAKAVAFLVKDDRISGYLDHGAQADEWYSFSLKKAKDGRAMIDKITRSYEGSKKTGRITYHRVKGVSVPKKFQYITLPGLPRHRFDICEYQFKKIRFSAPK